MIVHCYSSHDTEYCDTIGHLKADNLPLRMCARAYVLAARSYGTKCNEQIGGVNMHV